MDCLGVGIGVRPYYPFPCFMVRNIILIFYSEDLFFSPPNIARSCIDQMVTTTIRTFIGKFTFIHVVAGISLVTFPAHFPSSTWVLMVSIFLTPIASQWVRNKLLNLLHRVANLYFFWDFWCIECHNIGVCFYCFTLFFNRNSFDINHILFFNSFFISSKVHNDSSLLLTTPLLVFRDLWGYVLTAILLNIVIFNRKSACFLFSTSTSNVSFFNFFTDFGVILLDMTFSIMNGERLVIGKHLDSIEMNLGKGDSTSSSESVSLKFF